MREQMEDEETDRTPHEEWMDAWRKKFITDKQLLDGLFEKVVFQKVRITTEQGSSADHPDERIVVEGLVVGQGLDVLMDEGKAPDFKVSEVRRLSLVLDNGHAYHMKPGMTVEVWEEDRPGRNAHYSPVASFPR